jgi:hypothetical protein
MYVAGGGEADSVEGGGYIFSAIFWFMGVKNKLLAGIFWTIFSVFVSCALFVRTGSFCPLMSQRLE